MENMIQAIGGGETELLLLSFSPEFLSRTDLCLREKFTYLIIRKMISRSNNNYTIIKNSKLIKYLGKTDNTIIKYLKHLEELELIFIVLDNCGSEDKNGDMKAFSKRYIYLNKKDTSRRKSYITKRKKIIEKINDSKKFNKIMENPNNDFMIKYIYNKKDRPNKSNDIVDSLDLEYIPFYSTGEYDEPYIDG